jgi:hypothetical protein
MPEIINPEQKAPIMKKFLTILTLTAFAAIPATTFAAKKEAPAPAATPAPATPAKPAAKAPVVKPIPMYAHADMIDAAAKTFTTKRKDGVEVKNVVTATTEIKNGDAAAKFEDIKVGDYVSGLRLKKSDAEYEVVKISKFGPKAEKKAAAPAVPAAPGTATPAPKKPS